MKDSLIDSYAFLTIGLNSIPIRQWYSKCMGIDQQADKDEKFHVVLNAIKTKLYWEGLWRKLFIRAAIWK